MKKTVTLLLSTLLLACSLAACGNRAQEMNSSNHVSLEAADDAVESTDGSNILIVYFSRYGNTEYPDDVDATTSASIVADGTGRYGTTEYVANMIQQAVGGDVHRLETVAPYTEDFDELRVVNHEEMEQDVFPTAKHLVSWAGCCPRNDQSNKKIKSTRISRAGSYFKPVLVQVANFTF